MIYVARNKYQLPISLDNLISIDSHSSPAHLGKLENAVDFVALENTTVLAAAAGTVTYVKLRHLRKNQTPMSIEKVVGSKRAIALILVLSFLIC